MHRWMITVLTLSLLFGGAAAAPAQAAERVTTPSSEASLETQATGTIYYVRPDGGTPTQCTGRSDRAYPGSGTMQACAWKHPFYALPPSGSARIAGGDTLVIGLGSYMIGQGAPETTGICAYENCRMGAIPSGPSSTSRTRILGRGWNTGCTSPPELWGVKGVDRVLNLEQSDNVEVSCLKITDHENCIIGGHPTLQCAGENGMSFAQGAKDGILAYGSDNVVLRNLNIYGLAHTGITAGKLSNWQVLDVRIAMNGYAGWNGDVYLGPSSNSGYLTFRRATIEWNGCSDGYPNHDPVGCWSEYGDGVGTASTGGNWLFEDSIIRYNTSDGLDLLYLKEQNSSLVIRRSRFEGNAGNQVKNYRGRFSIQNSVVVGNCDFFAGKPFTTQVGHCRAEGNALSLGFTKGDQLSVTNNTIVSRGDGLIFASCSDGTCDGTERVYISNNILVGYGDYLNGGDTFLVYAQGFPKNPFSGNNNLINNVKNDACLGSKSLCNRDPQLVNASLNAFDANLKPTSPAIDAGLVSAGVPTTDFTNQPRDSMPDIGAYEYRVTQ